MHTYDSFSWFQRQGPTRPLKDSNCTPARNPFHIDTRPTPLKPKGQTAEICLALYNCFEEINLPKLIYIFHIICHRPDT